jgi:hypothetical protein
MARDPADDALEATRAVIRGAVAEHGVLRLHVPDPLGDSGRMRIIEGVAREVVTGKDGRERVVVAVETATEPVEIRLLVDRVERAERLQALTPAGESVPVAPTTVRTRRVTAAPTETPADGATRKYPAVRDTLANLLAETDGRPKRRS